jgi:ELWxxDGT repeat protein
MKTNSTIKAIFGLLFLFSLNIYGQTPMLVKDIYPGPAGSVPNAFINNKGILNFTVYLPTTPITVEQWQSDGTTAGTKINPNQNPLFNYTSVEFKGNTYSMDQMNSDTLKLYKTDLSGVRTVVKGLKGFNLSSQNQIYAGKDVFYFIAEFRDTTGLCCGYTDRSQVLWKSDGTAAGTVQVKQINSFGYRSTNNFQTALVTNNTIYLLLQENEVGQGLYICDGTAASYKLIERSSYPNFYTLHATEASGSLIYSKIDYASTTDINKYSNGIITKLANTNAPVVAAGAGLSTAFIFNIYGSGLWISDGTATGTKHLTDKYLIYYFKNTAGKLFAVSQDLGSSASDLLAISETGVSTVLSLHPVGLNSPNVLAIGNTLYYNNKTAAYGEELWKLDLTNFTVSTNICSSKSIEPWEMWISNVKFNTINNPSGKFKDYSLLGNSDYTNISTTVTKGQNLVINVNPSLSWNGYTPNVFARAWIDYNGNNIFEDSEKILEQTNTLTLSANVTIPTTAITGTVKMRVALKWDGYPTQCETFGRGEVEDYSIIIKTATDPCAGDVTPPTFAAACPTSRDIMVPYPQKDVNYDWQYLGVRDNCGAATEVVTPTNPLNQSVNILLGKSATLTHTATDSKGNTAKCTYTITAIPSPCEVSDITPPTVTCPPSFTVIAPAGQTTAITNFASPVAYDNCNVLGASVSTLPNGTVIVSSTPLPIGINTIKWTVADYKGNKASCTFNAIVTSSNNNKEDLEVSIVADKANPAIYSNVSFKVTVTNKGAVASGKFRVNMNTCAGGVIKTFIQNPGMLVYAGKPTVATQGFYSEVDQTWSFNSLAAGASATYTINAFTLSSKEIIMSAFVDQQTNIDFDSSPSATLPNCTPMQDDESAAIINKGSTRESDNNFDINEKILVFPNPAGELLNVNIANWDKKSVDIKIFNTLGIQVNNIQLDENHTPVQTIDISEIQDGNYYLFIESKTTRSQALKFVKQQSY